MKEESEKVGLKLNIQKTKIMASGPNTSWQIDGEKMQIVVEFIFLGSRITADGDAAKKLKDACSLEENYDKPRLRIKKQRHQSPYSQSNGFSSSHV